MLFIKHPYFLDRHTPVAFTLVDDCVLRVRLSVWGNWRRVLLGLYMDSTSAWGDKRGPILGLYLYTSVGA